MSILSEIMDEVEDESLLSETITIDPDGSPQSVTAHVHELPRVRDEDDPQGHAFIQMAEGRFTASQYTGTPTLRIPVDRADGSRWILSNCYLVGESLVWRFELERRVVDKRGRL